MYFSTLYCNCYAIFGVYVYTNKYTVLVIVRYRETEVQCAKYESTLRGRVVVSHHTVNSSAVFVMFISGTQRRLSLRVEVEQRRHSINRDTTLHDTTDRQTAFTCPDLTTWHNYLLTDDATPPRPHWNLQKQNQLHCHPNISSCDFYANSYCSL